MIKIDIFSGFLGAGKTTLIKKLLSDEVYKNEKLVLIENEFGEIGIDGGFLNEAGVEITEMNSGCICCSLVGDFAEALKKVITDFAPDRILIEPSGVGKLSDVVKAITDLGDKNLKIVGLVAVVDAKKCKMYTKNFGEFYNDQLKNATSIVLSRTKDMTPEKIEDALKIIRGINKDASIITTAWDELDGKKIFETFEGLNTLSVHIKNLEHEEALHECGHHHHEHCECEHHEHHDHHNHCDCEHEHEHHEECGCGHHHEHHEHCGCGHHHDHHADEVFSSWGCETAKEYSLEDITNALSEFEDKETYGYIIRAKGIVKNSSSGWIHFDYTPGEIDVRLGAADTVGRLCVIGSEINTNAISALFGTLE